MNLHFDIFVVIGNKGVGKSYLINDLFGQELVMENDNQVHVTKSQTEKIYNNLIIIDTVGFDIENRDFLNLSKYNNKNICLILLNNDFRIKTTVNFLCKFLNITKNDINIYNSYFIQRNTIKDIKPYENIKNDISVFKTFRYNNYLKSDLNNIIELKIKINRDKVNSFEYLYPNLDKRIFGQNQYKRRKLSNIDLILTKINLDYVKENRLSGDAIFRYYCLQQLKYSKSQVKIDCVISNNIMKSFLLDQLKIKRSWINNIYNEKIQELSDEKYGDILEAIFYFIYSDNNKYLYWILNEYFDYLRT